MKTRNRKFGDFGEDLAEKFLVKRGFIILDRNYLKKWGEIDIIAQKGEILHFVEVKTVSGTLNVIRETEDLHRAEDNIHQGKLKRISRTMQSYLLERNYEGEWQFDAVTVVIDKRTNKAKVSYIENIVL